MTDEEKNDGEGTPDATFTGLTREEKDSFLSTVTKAFCPVCGAPVDPVTGGRPRIFCSEKCRKIWKNRHTNYQNWKSARTVICPVCGKTFLAVRESKKRRKYCSRACANRAQGMKKRKIQPPGIDAGEDEECKITVREPDNRLDT